MNITVNISYGDIFEQHEIPDFLCVSGVFDDMVIKFAEKYNIEVNTYYEIFESGEYFLDIYQEGDEE